MLSQVTSDDNLILEGEIIPAPVVERVFKTLDAMSDYIRTFNISGGSWFSAESAIIGSCFVLQYPKMSQD